MRWLLLSLFFLPQAPAAEYEIQISGKITISIVETTPTPPPPPPPPPDDPDPLPAIVNVGPGQKFAELHDLDPTAIPAKAVIRLHYRKQPYRSHLAITKPGVTLEGIAGPKGERPIISGADRKTHARCPLPENIQAASIVCVSRIKQGDPVTIKGLEIRDCWEQDLLTLANGTEREYGKQSGAACIRVTAGDVTIEDCRLSEGIHGLFAKCAEGHLVNVTMRRCEIVQCGNWNANADEAIYTECRNTILEKCRIHSSRNTGTQPIHTRDAEMHLVGCYLEGGLLSILSNSCDSDSPLMASGRIPSGELEVKDSILDNSSASEMIGLRTDWAWPETKHHLKITGSTLIKRVSGYKSFWVACRHSSQKVDVSDSTFICLAPNPAAIPAPIYFSVGEGETLTFSGKNKLILQAPRNEINTIWQKQTGATFAPANWRDTFTIEGNLTYGQVTEKILAL